MSLSKEDRISISKKIVSIPLENQGADNTVEVLEMAKLEAEKKDNGNKSIQNNIESFLNKYQLEVELLDGKKREVVTEQDMVNSAKRTKANFFFPNTPLTPLPSLPDGVWKNFPPFSRSKAVGKKYFEDQDTIKKEQDIIDDIKQEISNVESFAEAERSSGRSCQIVDLGSCDPDNGETSQQECTMAGGTWTPMLSSVSGESGLVSILENLETLLDEWKTFLLDEQSKIVTNDSDSAKQEENDTAIEDIDNTIKVIEEWREYQDFDTSKILPEKCSSFYNLDKDDFDESKLRPDEFNILKNEVEAREEFTQIRKDQVLVNLGSIDQDIDSGTINGGSGLYFKRFRIIDQRLNVMNGSLSQKIGIEQGIGAQDQLKQSNGIAENAYADVMFASLFKAAASGTGTVHVNDSSGFSVGDTVYVAAEKQEEIEAKVVNVDENTLFLDNNIPKKYTNGNMARVYKLL